MATTFHALVGHALNWAKLWDASRIGWDEFREKSADLLMDAANIIRTPGLGLQAKLFDAIIVDEAQDFEDTW